MRVNFQLEGGKEFEDNLRTLGNRIEKKVIRHAVRQAQKPILSATKASASSMVGGRMGSVIAKSLQIRAPRRQRAGAYALNVQLRSGVNEFVHITKGGKRHYIPAAIEYGHLTGDTFVPPIPYMRQAADSRKNESFRIFADELRKGLLREAIKTRYK